MLSQVLSSKPTQSLQENEEFKMLRNFPFFCGRNAKFLSEECFFFLKASCIKKSILSNLPQSNKVKRPAMFRQFHQAELVTFELDTLNPDPLIAISPGDYKKLFKTIYNTTCNYPVFLVKTPITRKFRKLYKNSLSFFIKTYVPHSVCISQSY